MYINWFIYDIQSLLNMYSSNKNCGYYWKQKLVLNKINYPVCVLTQLVANNTFITVHSNEF